ncbi:MAG: hypothetical protein J5I90_00440 [Caldilineales bacterium]|nr:hypothetical protein [Caldilineales bacterium]
MHRRWFPMFLTLLLVAAFLYMGGSAIYQNGWQQGFLVGQLVDGGDSTALPLAMAARPGFGSGFGFLGSCLFFGFLLLLGGMAFKFFAMRRWAMGGWGQGMSDEEKQAKMERWAAHWHGHHGWSPPQPAPVETAVTPAQPAAPTPPPASTPPATDEIDDTTIAS